MAAKKSSSNAAVKRSIARRFNDSLIGRSSRTATDKSLDRRTAKRLARYREELNKGKKVGDKDLTALDIAHRVNELLKYGDRMAEIRKLIKARVVDYDTDLLVGVLKEMHPIYQFRPEAYRFAGVRNEELVAAGILDHMPTKRGPAPGTRPKKKTQPPPTEEKEETKKASKSTSKGKGSKTTKTPKPAKKSTKGRGKKAS